MTEEKLKEVFISNSETSQVYTAFMFVTERLFEDSVAASIVPSLNDNDRAYNCGRASAISDLMFMVREYSKREDQEI